MCQTIVVQLPGFFLTSTGPTDNNELKIEGIMVAYINYICPESLKIELFIDYNNFDDNEISIEQQMEKHNITEMKKMNFRIPTPLSILCQAWIEKKCTLNVGEIISHCREKKGIKNFLPEYFLQYYK